MARESAPGLQILNTRRPALVIEAAVKFR